VALVTDWSDVECPCFRAKKITITRPMHCSRIGVTRPVSLPNCCQCSCRTGAKNTDPPSRGSSACAGCSGSGSLLGTTDGAASPGTTRYRSRSERKPMIPSSWWWSSCQSASTVGGRFAGVGLSWRWLIGTDS
jgi:hypothetical protein